MPASHHPPRKVGGRNQRRKFKKPPAAMIMTIIVSRRPSAMDIDEWQKLIRQKCQEVSSLATVVEVEYQDPAGNRYRQRDWEEWDGNPDNTPQTLADYFAKGPVSLPQKEEREEYFGPIYGDERREQPQEARPRPKPRGRPARSSAAASGRSRGSQDVRDPTTYTQRELDNVARHSAESAADQIRLRLKRGRR